MNGRTILEDYDTSTASGRLKINIMLSVAQDEADRTSKRIKVVFDSKWAKNGLPGAANLSFHLLHVGFSKLCGHDLRNGNDSRHHHTGRSRKSAFHAEDNHQKSEGKQDIFVFRPHELPYMRREDGRKIPPRKNDERLYYVCGRSCQLGGCTNTKNYTEEMIECYLLDHIDSKLQLMMELRRKPPASHKPQRDAPKKKLARLSELWIDELIEKEDYKRQYESLTAALAVIPEDERSIDMNAIQSRFSGDWKNLYAELSADGKRAFWRQCLSAVYLDPEARAVLNFDSQ